VALEVVRALGHAPSRPEVRIPLGDDRLLSMDMTESAAYFDVPVSIGKRDRKSGSTKRKQREIEAERTMTLPFNEPQFLSY
jgi:DNA (cytosine-5)-methyltransferase 1